MPPWQNSSQCVQASWHHPSVSKSLAGFTHSWSAVSRWSKDLWQKIYFMIFDENKLRRKTLKCLRHHCLSYDQELIVMCWYCVETCFLFLQLCNVSNTCLKWGYKAHGSSIPPSLLRPMIDLAPARKTLGVLGCRCGCLMLGQLVTLKAQVWIRLKGRGTGSINARQVTV